jgi:hypothetical protein
LVGGQGPDLLHGDSGSNLLVGGPDTNTLSGLQHQDALEPIDSGINPQEFTPTYTGPQTATETPRDVMASPDAVGSTLSDAAGINGPTYLGERDAVKLAFNQTGTVLQRQNLPATAAPVSSNLFGTPFTIDNVSVLRSLPSPAVPNPLPAGVTGAGQTFAVSALAVNSTLYAPNLEDFYSFTGQAGELNAPAGQWPGPGQHHDEPAGRRHA